MKKDIPDVESEIMQMPETYIIKVASVVDLKYLNNDQKIKVKLCSELSALHGKSNGIQIINIKSPLGISLMGKKVGDTIKVGNLDNYVEILEINN